MESLLQALLVAVWAIVFDETHGAATWARTYLDKEELVGLRVFRDAHFRRLRW